MKKGFGDEKILMAIRRYFINSKKEEYGVALLESQTNVITLGYINNNDLSYDHLKTLLI